MRYFRLFSFALIFVLLFSAASWSGIYILANQESQMGKMITKVFAENDRIRIESSGMMQNMIIIFRGDKQLFWMINTNDNTYYEMTKQDMEKISSKMDEATEMMKQNMTPEQYEMMQKYMKGKMPEQEKQETVYNKKESGVKINKWKCTHYEGIEGGKKVSDVWTASWQELGFTKEDFDVFKELSKFSESFSKNQKSGFMMYGEQEEKSPFDGFPVRTIDYDRGNNQQTFNIEEIKKQNNKSSLFDLPSGVEKVDQQMGKMPGGIEY